MDVPLLNEPPQEEGSQGVSIEDAYKELENEMDLFMAHKRPMKLDPAEKAAMTNFIRAVLWLPVLEWITVPVLLELAFSGHTAWCNVIIGAVCVVVVLCGCAAYMLPKMTHKPVAQPAQSVSAHAIAHVAAVTVTSVQLVEVPKKKDVEPEPTSAGDLTRGATAQFEESEPTSVDGAARGTRIEVVFEKERGLAL